MDYKRLDQKIESILRDDLRSKTYSDVKEELQQAGYDQEEIRYIMGIIDEQGLFPLAANGKNASAIRNMIIGGALSLIALGVVVSLYLGSEIRREVYFVAIAVFALGYVIFRAGFRQKGKN